MECHYCNKTIVGRAFHPNGPWGMNYPFCSLLCLWFMEAVWTPKRETNEETRARGEE